MHALAEDLLQALLKADWKIVSTEPGPAMSLSLPPLLVARYGALPDNYQTFLLAIEFCVHPLQDAWFLGLQDFSGSSEPAFFWDEFEGQSLVAAEDDEAGQEEIRKYWDKVLPIAQSVRSGYAYLGLHLKSDHFGAVVLGREPEFEEAVMIAASFTDLCHTIVDHLKGRRAEALADFS